MPDTYEHILATNGKPSLNYLLIPADLAKALYYDLGLTIGEARDFVDDLFEVLGLYIVRDGVITIDRLGAFRHGKAFTFTVAPELHRRINQRNPYKKGKPVPPLTHITIRHRAEKRIPIAFPELD